MINIIYKLEILFFILSLFILACNSKQDNPRDGSGSVKLWGEKEITAGEQGFWRIDYTVGEGGIKRGGRIIVRLSDEYYNKLDLQYPFLFETVKKPGLTEIEVEEKARFEPYFFRVYDNADYTAACFILQDRELMEGEKLYIYLGADIYDTSYFPIPTSAGVYEFILLTDANGDGQYKRVKGDLTVIVKPTQIHRLEIGTPLKLLVGEPFNITIRALDRFNNIAEEYSQTVDISILDSNTGQKVWDQIKMLTLHSIKFDTDSKGSITLKDNKITRPGSYFITVDDFEMNLHALSGPVIVTATP